MLVQDAADRTLGDVQSALAHLPDDARETGGAAVVDPHDGIDLLLSDPGPAGFLLLGIPVAVGLPLLKPLQPADQRIRRDDPGEEFTERPDQPLHRSRMGDALAGRHVQPTAMQAALRRRELLVDSRDEIIDRQAKGGPAEHPQADAEAEGERLGLDQGGRTGHGAAQGCRFRRRAIRL